MFFPAITLHHYVIYIAIDSRHLLEPSGFWCHRYLPISFCQVYLPQVFLATKSSEQIFCCCHGFWVHFAGLVNIWKSTHPIRTYLLLHHDDRQSIWRCPLSHHSHLQHTIHFVPQLLPHGI